MYEKLLSVRHPVGDQAAYKARGAAHASRRPRSLPPTPPIVMLLQLSVPALFATVAVAVAGPLQTPILMSFDGSVCCELAGNSAKLGQRLNDNGAKFDPDQGVATFCTAASSPPCSNADDVFCAGSIGIVGFDVVGYNCTLAC
ncbi:hypothetical protein MSAN_00338300 [Mycena sanguinolenta]|uniref:Hydrophobin n=1 Tax=Mycena sanguinolenta TaxID=230812 RepID=A0A8H6ZBF9_9AGAR|nr:hypothetical protein MSAN_00338300 [Mycena sanguinolenta]